MRGDFKGKKPIVGMGACVAEDLTSPGKHPLPYFWLAIIIMTIVVDVGWHFGL